MLATNHTPAKPVTLALVIAASRVLAALQPVQAAAASGQGLNLMPALAGLDIDALSADLATLLDTTPQAVQAKPLHDLIRDLAGFVGSLPAYLASIEQTGPALDALTQALQGVTSELPNALAATGKG